MSIKVSDFLPPSQYGDTDTRQLLDYLGVYVAEQIAKVHILTGGAYVCDIPNKIIEKANEFAETLPKEKNTDYTSDDVTITITSYPRQEMQNALSDTTTNLYKLLLSWKTTFDTTQGICLTQFNTPNTPPPPPLKGPELFPFVYIPQTFFNPINTALTPALPLIATAIEAFMSAQYAARGGA